MQRLLGAGREKWRKSSPSAGRAGEGTWPGNMHDPMGTIARRKQFVKYS